MLFSARATHSLFFIIAMGFALTVGAQQDSASDNHHPSNDAPPYSLERITWRQEMSQGQHLVVDNAWGDIHVRQTGDKTAVVHAVMQKIGAQPKTGEMKNHQQDQTHRVAFIYPENQQPSDVRDGRIDVSILLPYGVSLELHAARGSISSKKLESPLTIRATGDVPISLKSKNKVDIRAAAGTVDLHLLAGKATDRGRIQTLSGDIIVHYYADQPFSTAIVSGASKTTNDLQLLQSRRYEGRTVLMRKGDNPPHLDLQSDTGYIIIDDFGAHRAD